MSKHSFFLRYTSLIKKLRTAPASFDVIQKHFRREGEVHDLPLEISQRTLQRDIKEIRSLFNIDIQCNSNHEYFISSNEDETFNTRTLEAFDLFSSLNMTENVSSFVHFDSRKAKGTEHMFGLMHAIKNRVRIEISYCKFWESKASSRTLEPFALKESQGRWYLIAKDIKDKHIKTYGLDRIVELAIRHEKFARPKDFDVHEKFKDAFGITDLKDAKTERVVLQVYIEQADYLLTYPLHPSQKVIERNDEFVTIQIEVKVAFDLVREILSHGDNIEVLKPASLRREMREQLKSSLGLYRDK